MVSGLSVASPLWIFQNSLFVPWAIKTGFTGDKESCTPKVPFRVPQKFLIQHLHQDKVIKWWARSGTVNFHIQFLPSQSWFCWIKVTDISFYFFTAAQNSSLKYLCVSSLKACVHYFFTSFLTIPAKIVSIRVEKPLSGGFCHLKWFHCGLNAGERIQKGGFEGSKAAVGEPSSKRFWIKASLPCLRGSKEVFSLRIPAQLKGSLLRECFSHTAHLNQGCQGEGDPSTLRGERTHGGAGESKPSHQAFKMYLNTSQGALTLSLIFLLFFWHH